MQHHTRASEHVQLTDAVARSLDDKGNGNCIPKACMCHCDAGGLGANASTCISLEANEGHQLRSEVCMQLVAGW